MARDEGKCQIETEKYWRSRSTIGGGNGNEAPVEKVQPFIYIDMNFVYWEQISENKFKNWTFIIIVDIIHKQVFQQRQTSLGMLNKFESNSKFKILRFCCCW